MRARGREEELWMKTGGEGKGGGGGGRRGGEGTNAGKRSNPLLPALYRKTHKKPSVHFFS